MDTQKVTMWIFHGGSFQNTPNLVYEEGECSIVHIDPLNITLDFISEEVIRMGYSQDRIKAIYFSHEHLPFHESLVPLENNDEFRELVQLAVRDCIPPRLYVGHELQSESDADDLDYVLDEEFVEYDTEFQYESNSDVDDEDVLQAREKIRKMKKRMTSVNDQGETENVDLFDPGEDDSQVEDSDEEEYQRAELGLPKSRVKKRVGLITHNGDVDIVLGAQFLDKEHFKRCLDNYRITKGYSIKVSRSSTKRMQAVCLGTGCEWTCWVSPLGRELTWAVKVVTKPHTCIPFSFVRGKRHMTSDWLCNKYVQTFIDTPDIKVREFRLMANRELNMKLTHSICNEARRKAMIQIVGDYKAQFGQLRAYCHEVLTHNPGSTVKIKTDLNEKGEAVFRAIYMCVESLRNGFLEGCRRVVSLDGCFLKGPWDGQLLAAVGRDANNQMYPIAWGVAESETTESWRWFIELLQTDLGMGNGEGWTLISDQQKGLINAVNFFLPNIEHRMCARHVYANVRKWWRGLQYRNIFWKLAKSSNEPHFNKYKTLFQNLSSEAWDFIEKKEPKHFCRRFFKVEAKCDSVDNNMAEVFNATIVEARFKPIVTMLDEIFTQTMTRIAKRYKWAAALQLPITPRILTKLQKRIQKANYWDAHDAGNGLWSVRHGLEGFIVSIHNNTCTCGSWQLSGIPCPHAIAVFRENQIDPHTCVHDCYGTEYLRATYKHAMHPINGLEMWTEPSEGGAPIVAPFFKLRRKGLRTKRVPEAGEVAPRSTGRLSRAGSQKHCSRCKKPGHNKKGCKEILQHEEASTNQNETVEQHEDRLIEEPQHDEQELQRIQEAEERLIDELQREQQEHTDEHELEMVQAEDRLLEQLEREKAQEAYIELEEFNIHCSIWDNEEREQQEREQAQAHAENDIQDDIPTQQSQNIEPSAQHQQNEQSVENQGHPSPPKSRKRQLSGKPKYTDKPSTQAEVYPTQMLKHKVMLRLQQLQDDIPTQHAGDDQGQNAGQNAAENQGHTSPPKSRKYMSGKPKYTVRKTVKRSTQAVTFSVPTATASAPLMIAANSTALAPFKDQPIIPVRGRSEVHEQNVKELARKRKRLPVHTLSGSTWHHKRTRSQK